MDGLSFQFGQVTTTPVDVTVGRDTPGMKKNVTDFADAYNAMVQLIRDQTRYDDSTDTAGVLQADSSALGVLRGLRTLASSSSGAVTTFTRLADIGLEPQSDGSLKINDKKLDAAMGQIADLSGFFSKDDADNALDGFGQTFRTFADLRLGTGGELTTRQEAIQKRIDQSLERADALEARLVLVEKRLTAQYGRLDSSMAQLNSLQSYVTQQIAAWNKSS
jgi:flagellar hook-associated protein 2